MFLGKQLLFIPRLRLAIAPVDWVIKDMRDAGREIATSDEDYQSYRPKFEALIGCRVTEIDIDPNAGLALRIVFDNGKYFQLSPWIVADDDIERECWSLSCSDAHFLLVGERKNQWRSVHKDQSMY